MGYSHEAELDAVNERNRKIYTPAIVIITVVIAVGLCLNVLASVYYGCKARKSVFQIFALSLSINFVITNLVLINDIVELFYFISLKGSAACKLFYVLKHWFVANCLAFMVAIGFERYRSVCFPFSKSLSFRTAWSVIIVLTTISFGISASLFATTDAVPIRITTSWNTTIQGSICSFSEHFQNVRKVFHFVDIVLHSIISFLLVFFYTFIVRKLIITRKKVSSNKNVKNEVPATKPKQQSEMSTAVSSTKNEGERVGRSCEQPQGRCQKQSDENMESIASRNEKAAHEIQIATGETNHCKTNALEPDNVGTGAVVDVAKTDQSLHTFSRTKQAKGKAKIERKITVMATVTTVATIACFLPYYVSMITVSPKLNGDGLVIGTESVVTRRSYMLNSVVNPLIMIIFNDAFRQYVKETFTMLYQKLGKGFRLPK